jgi:hypothetical protein
VTGGRLLSAVRRVTAGSDGSPQYLGSHYRDASTGEPYCTEQFQTTEDVSYRGIVQIEQIGDRATAQLCGELAV